MCGSRSGGRCGSTLSRSRDSTTVSVLVVGERLGLHLKQLNVEPAELLEMFKREGSLLSLS